MPKPSRFVIFAGTAVIVAAGFAWREMRLARQSVAAALALRQPTSAVESSIRLLEERVAVIGRQRAELEATLVDLKRAKVAALIVSKGSEEAASVTTEAKLTAWLKAIQEDQKKPEAELLQLAASRNRLAVTYAPLFRSLGLSADQMAKFQDNAIKRDEQQTDLLAVMRAHGLDHSDPVLGRIWSQMEPDYQAAQRNLLGEENYERFRDFDRKAPLRDTVAAIAGAAAVNGIPFTKDQAEQLVDVMAKANSTYASGGKAQPIYLDWKTVDSAAETILTPEQLTLFKTIDPAIGQGGRAFSIFNRVVNEAIAAEKKAR